MKRNDLQGKRIGYWDVGEPFHKEGRIYFHCTCSLCGTERDVISTALNTGKSLSCGCHHKHNRIEDITGQGIGLLHIEERVLINNRTWWRCTCQCGNHVFISQHQIHDCNVRSCGCRSGIGEKIREKLSPYCVNGTYLPAIQRKKNNKNNTSGCTGVSFRKDRNKWRAYIKFQRKYIHIGYFDLYEDAVAARKIAEKEYFGRCI